MSNKYTKIISNDGTAFAVYIHGSRGVTVHRISPLRSGMREMRRAFITLSGTSPDSLTPSLRLPPPSDAARFRLLSRCSLGRNQHAISACSPDARSRVRCVASGVELGIKPRVHSPSRLASALTTALTLSASHLGYVCPRAVVSASHRLRVCTAPR